MSDMNYVIMLRESLEKKIEVLEEIEKANEDQRQVLLDPMATPDDLHDSVERKDKLIDALDKLDNGFDELYKRVRKEISENKEIYAEEIRKMKELIPRISDLSATLQAEELRNKDLATAKFSSIRSQIAKVNKNRAAVDSYYKSMGKINLIDPQFMDKKK